MELAFEKWDDGRWFVVLPDYDGDQENLEIIDGADTYVDRVKDPELIIILTRILKSQI